MSHIHLKKQKKAVIKKQWIILFIIAAAGVLGLLAFHLIGKKGIDAPVTTADFSTRRIFLKLKDGEELKNEDNVIAEYDGAYLLSFKTERNAKDCYDYYKDKAEFIDTDGAITVADSVYNRTADDADFQTNPLDGLKTAEKTAKPQSAKTIALIDTGVKDYIPVKASYSVVGSKTVDDNGHGTQMFYAMKEQNPEASIVSIKAADRNGHATSSSVYAAMTLADKIGCQIINVSMTSLDLPGTKGVQYLTKELTAKGVTVVTSAGDNDTRVDYTTQAQSNNALIVGACDKNGTPGKHSNYGDKIDYYAKADSSSKAAAVLSGYLTNNTAITPDGNTLFVDGQSGKGAAKGEKDSSYTGNMPGLVINDTETGNDYPFYTMADKMNDLDKRQYGITSNDDLYITSLPDSIGDLNTNIVNSVTGSSKLILKKDEDRHATQANMHIDRVDTSSDENAHVDVTVTVPTEDGNTAQGSFRFRIKKNGQSGEGQIVNVNGNVIENDTGEEFNSDGGQYTSIKEEGGSSSKDQTVSDTVSNNDTNSTTDDTGSAGDQNSTDDIGITTIDGSGFETRRLLVHASEELPKYTENIIAHYNDVYLLQFHTVREAQNAYVWFYKAGYEVQKDALLYAASSKAGEIEASESEMSETDNPFAKMQEELTKGETYHGCVMLADTGAPTDDSVVKSVTLLDKNTKDKNGHATENVKNILSRDKNAKIVAVKVLGDNGIGYTSSAMAAAWYAKETNADYLVMPFASVDDGNYDVASVAIKEAEDGGVTIVAAAGNNALNTVNVFPAGVDGIITAGASDEEGSRRTVSNYGKNVAVNVAAKTTSEAACKLAGEMANTQETEAKTKSGFAFDAETNTRTEESRGELLYNGKKQDTKWAIKKETLIVGKTKIEGYETGKDGKPVKNYWVKDNVEYIYHPSEQVLEKIVYPDNFKAEVTTPLPTVNDTVHSTSNQIPPASVQGNGVITGIDQNGRHTVSVTSELSKWDLCVVTADLANKKTAKPYIGQKVSFKAVRKDIDTEKGEVEYEFVISENGRDQNAVMPGYSSLTGTVSATFYDDTEMKLPALTEDVREEIAKQEESKAAAEENDVLDLSLTENTEEKNTVSAAFNAYGEPVKEEETPKAAEEEEDFSQARLLVGTSDPSVLRADADKVISCYDGVYLIQYDSADEAKQAYNLYNGRVDYLETDTTAVKATENGGEASESAEAGTDQKMTDEANPIARMENDGNGSDINIALIDTGASKGKNVVDAVSMIGDKTDDDNGHGTKMVETMVSVNPNLRILSIKALDADGNGSPSAVYAGIEYAIERGAKLINLSFSGPKTKENSIIAKAIEDAYQAGSIVIGAAGNDGINADYTIPGGVNHTGIAGACDANGNRLALSNYGKTVNYYVVANSTSEAAAILTANASLNNWVPKADGKTIFEPDENGNPDTDPETYIVSDTDSGVKAATAESGSLRTLQAYKNNSNTYLSDVYHISAEEFIKRLTKNEKKYLGTPYGAYDTTWKTMQCGGFIWRALKDAGLDVFGDKTAFPDSRTPFVSSYENYWRSKGVHMEAYVTKEELLRHHPQKGDIIIMHPRNDVEWSPYETKFDNVHNVSDAHIGIYWGRYDFDDYMWHSYHGNGGYLCFSIPVGPESWYYQNNDNQYPANKATKFINLRAILGESVGTNGRTAIAPKCDSWYLLIRWRRTIERGSIAIQKGSADGTKKLQGAQFTLYKGSDIEKKAVGGRTYYVVKQGAKPVTYESVKYVNQGLTQKGNIVLTTNQNGEARSVFLPKIAEGYYLQETKAPANYEAMKNPADPNQNYVYKVDFINEGESLRWTKLGNNPIPQGPRATLQIKLTKTFNGKTIDESTQQAYSYAAKIQDCGATDPGTAPSPSSYLPSGTWMQWENNLAFGKTQTKVISDTTSKESTKTWVAKHKYYLVAIKENTPPDGSKPDDRNWHYLILQVSYDEKTGTATSNLGTVLRGGNINNTGTEPPSPHGQTPPPVPDEDGELHIIKQNWSQETTRLNPEAYSLAGTVFGLYDSNHKLIREYTLTGSGDEISLTIKVKGNARYYLEELKAGKNFNPKPINLKDGVWIGAGQTYTKTVGNSANLASQIHVIKHDKVSGKRLEGASFAVYAVKNGSESYVCDMADIGNGEYVSQMITLDPETNGLYRVKETAAPIGHTGNVTIDVNLNKTAPFTHSLYEYCDNASTPVTVRLRKTDYEDATKNLSDGTFTIAPLIGRGQTGTSTEMTWSAAHQCYEAVVQPDENNNGRFKIEETKAPDQYQGGWSQIVQLDTSKLTDVFEFTAVNKLIPYTGEIHMQKLDEDTGEKYKDGLFQVYEYDASANAYKTTPITKMVWDEDKQEWNLGRTWNDQTQSWDYHKLNCYYKASDMQFYGHYNLGKFKIVEERQPAGCLYEKKEVEVTFEKPERRDITTSKDVIIKNKKNNFYVTKVNAKGKPLSGVTYRFGSLDDDPGAYRKGTTDENGKLSMVGLKTGRWVYYEESTQDGYTLDETKKYFTIDADGRIKGQNGIEIGKDTNYSKVNLSITKTASDGTITNNFPEGTTFAVREWDKNRGAYKDEIYCSASWDKNQKIFVDASTMKEPALSYTPENEGKFKVEETQASNGYILDTKSKEIVIPSTPDIKEVSVAFQNTSNLFELTKLDESGKKLDGVTFHIWKDGETDSAENYHVTKDGKITLRGLTPGLWYYQETAAPDGYYVNPAQGQFTVQPDGKIDSKDELRVVRIDYPEGKLKISKISDNIIDNFPEGTEFLLYEYDTATGTYKDTPSMRIIYKEQS